MNASASIASERTPSARSGRIEFGARTRRRSAREVPPSSSRGTWRLLATVAKSFPALGEPTQRVPDPIALRHDQVRFGPLCGLKSDIAQGPRSAINVRFASRRTAAKFASLFDEARRRRTRYSELDYSGKLRAMASALISTVRKASQPSAGK